MDKKTTSETKEETTFVDRLTGGSQFRTTIYDNSRYIEVSGVGNTSEESQKVASEKWDRLNKQE